MTLAQYYRLHENEINKAISSALKEDKVHADVTTKLLLSGKAGDEKLNAILLCKEDCVLAGLDIFKKVYKQIDPKVTFKTYKHDGAYIKKRTKVLEVRTSLRNLLIGERTSLNFLQRMSGIATLTNIFVKQLKYRNAKILHTRKTTPNFRVFEAAAVKTGGGDFHRLSLASSVMIKDNHIIALGDINDVMNFLTRKKLSPSVKHKFEIEVKNVNELDTVIKYGKGIVKVVMLDNFDVRQIEKAALLLKKNGFKTELSGGINIDNINRIQRRGIDYYSIGSLTHSYKSTDFSLEF